MGRSPSSSALLSVELVKGTELHPNPWNPNRMTAFMYAKVSESIDAFGFIDPVTAFWHDSRRVIIDGEHRWRVGMDKGIAEYPTVMLDVSEIEARKLTVVLNELHGQADPEKLTELLGGLLEENGMPWLVEALPFTDDVLAGMLATRITELPDVAPPPRKEPSGERWVEKLLRMPEPVADLYDEAIDRAREDTDTKDWQALERIIADFLAS